MQTSENQPPLKKVMRLRSLYSPKLDVRTTVNAKSMTQPVRNNLNRPARRPPLTLTINNRGIEDNVPETVKEALQPSKSKPGTSILTTLPKSIELDVCHDAPKPVDANSGPGLSPYVTRHVIPKLKLSKPKRNRESVSSDPLSMGAMLGNESRKIHDNQNGSPSLGGGAPFLLQDISYQSLFGSKDQSQHCEAVSFEDIHKQATKSNPNPRSALKKRETVSEEEGADYVLEKFSRLRNLRQKKVWQPKNPRLPSHPHDASTQHLKAADTAGIPSCNRNKPERRVYSISQLQSWRDSSYLLDDQLRMIPETSVQKPTGLVDCVPQKHPVDVRSQLNQDSICLPHTDAPKIKPSKETPSYADLQLLLDTAPSHSYTDIRHLLDSQEPISLGPNIPKVESTSLSQTEPSRKEKAMLSNQFQTNITLSPGKCKTVTWDPRIADGNIVSTSTLEPPTKARIQNEARNLIKVDKFEKARKESAKPDEFAESIRFLKSYDKPKLKRLLKALKEIDFEDAAENGALDGRPANLKSPAKLDPTVPEFKVREDSAILQNIKDQSIRLALANICNSQSMIPTSGNKQDSPATPQSNKRKRVVLDDHAATGREICRFDDWYAQMQLARFREKFPLTGIKAASSPDDVSYKPQKRSHVIATCGPGIEAHAAMIQLRLELLLYKEKEARAMKGGYL